MKKKFEFKKLLRKRIIIPLIIVILIVVVVINGKNSATNVGYTETEALRQDIVNYLEFSGTVKATESKVIYSEVSAQVINLLVEEGDEVHEGDVIAYLDSSNIEYEIESAELSVEASNDSYYYTLKNAKKSLNDIQYALDQGLNAQANGAQATLLNAQDSFYNAVDNYNNRYDDYVKAKSKYDNCGGEANIYALQHNYDEAKKAYDNASDFAEKAGYDEDAKENYFSTIRYNLEYASKNLEAAKQNYKDAMDNAKTALDSAKESMDKAEERLASAKIDYETTMLSINQNIQSYKDRIEETNSTIENSNASSELKINHMKESLDDYVIHAPIDGYITTLNLKLCEKFISTTPAATITNFDDMEVSLNIDEYDISKVEKGMPVDVYINSLDKSFKGEISNIAMTATSTNGVSYINATVTFDADGMVMSGLSCEIKLIKDSKENVVTVLESAISYRDDHTAYVLVKTEKGAPEERDVTLGVSDGTYVEVLDGINEGDVILYVPALSPLDIMMSM